MQHKPDEPITIDTETIPSQDEAVKERLGAALRAEAKTEIETLAPPKNLKDEEKIAAWWEETGLKKKNDLFFAAEDAAEQAWRKTALDAAYGQLAVVCIKVGGDTPIQLFDQGFAYREPGYEAWLLNEVNKTLGMICGHHLGQLLLGHNLEFDRRFLRQRGILRGVQMHKLLTAMHRPWDEATLDTQALWTGDYRAFVKLEKLCEILDLQGKGEEIGEQIDGSMVWDFVARGEIAKVAGYCAGDVDRTYAAYRRLRQLDPVPQIPYTPSAQACNGEAWMKRA